MSDDKEIQRQLHNKKINDMAKKAFMAGNSKKPLKQITSNITHNGFNNNMATFFQTTI
jgi:uncharacterized protein YijF (DUF1287 family)